VAAAAALSTLSLALIRLQIDGHPLGTAPVVARNLVLVWALAHTLALLHTPDVPAVSAGTPLPGPGTERPAALQGRAG
jgi:hypothetical protein